MYHFVNFVVAFCVFIIIFFACCFDKFISTSVFGYRDCRLTPRIYHYAVSVSATLSVLNQLTNEYQSESSFVNVFDQGYT